MLDPHLKSTTGNLMHFDWHATDALPCDQQQSHRLHEPRFRIMTTDPVSGNEVENYMDHCSLIDGNLSIYFETKENCEEYQNMPFNHPAPHLPYDATEDDDRGG